MKQTKLREYMSTHPMRSLGIAAGIGAAIVTALGTILGIKRYKKKRRQKNSK